MFDYWRFEDKRPHEQILAVIRRHPVFLLKGIIIILGLLILTIGALVFFKLSVISLIAAIIGIIFIILVSYYYLYLWYNDIYVLTDERIIDIDQNGLFNRTLAETSLDQIQEVKIEVKGPMESIFGFGKIIVQTAGPSENLILELTPKPFSAQRVINKAIYDYRKKIGIDREVQNA